jgi:hypothetical protein
MIVGRSAIETSLVGQCVANRGDSVRKCTGPRSLDNQPVTNMSHFVKVVGYDADQT